MPVIAGGKARRRRNEREAKSWPGTRFTMPISISLDGQLSGLTMLDKSHGGHGNQFTSTHASSRGNLPGIKLASGETKHRDAYGKETSFSYIRPTDKRPRLSPTDLSTVIPGSTGAATHSQFLQLSAPASSSPPIAPRASTRFSFSLISLPFHLPYRPINGSQQQSAPISISVATMTL